MPCCSRVWSQPSQKTYTVPVLSLRTVQPLCPLTSANLPEDESGMFTSVSLDQLPKNWLDAALSAQICSLSANAAALLLPVITDGGIQADLTPAAAAGGSSVRETPMASTPLNPASLRFAERLEVRLA